MVGWRSCSLTTTKGCATKTNLSELHSKRTATDCGSTLSFLCTSFKTGFYPFLFFSHGAQQWWTTTAITLEGLENGETVPLGVPYRPETLELHPNPPKDQEVRESVSFFCLFSLLTEDCSFDWIRQ